MWMSLGLSFAVAMVTGSSFCHRMLMIGHR